MKKHHHWVFIAIAIVILYHYRSQLLALWHTDVAPLLASVLPPSVAAVMGAGRHPLDIPAGLGDLFGGGYNQRNSPSITGLGFGKVQCTLVSGGPNGGFTSSCGEVALHQGFHPPLQV